MRAALTFGTVIVAMCSSVAHATPITVWLQDDAPDEKSVERADRQTDGTAHLWRLQLAYPPEPEAPIDAQRIEAVTASVEAGRDRWDEFEIERLIADDIRLSLEDLDLVRDEADREDLVEALLFQGTAVARGFAPDDFATGDAAAPHRLVFGEVVVPRAWVDAYALMGRAPERGELSDGTAWADYQRFASEIAGLAKASLTIPADIGQVVVDGREVEPGRLALPPGRHYVHVLRDDAVHARAVLELGPGETADVPSRVTDDDVAQAVALVLDGKGRGLPERVDASLALLEDFHEGSVFLAALDGNRPEVVAWKGAARLNDDRLVTVLLTADLGGGVHVTPLFQENPGDPTRVAGAMNAGLGFELGVSYFLFSGGVDATITPGNTLQYQQNPTENGAASVFPMPWVGLGAYFVRPTQATPTVNLAATFGWSAPAHLLYGGRLAVGLPIDDDGHWVRLGLGGSYGPDTTWDLAGDPNPLISGFFRVGFGARL